MTIKKKSFPEALIDLQDEQSKDLIQTQLDHIINSPLFEATKAQNAFLRYIVEKVLNGQSDDIKGYTVATEVFGRGEDFDQSRDPVVSIHANKLRRALEHYYIVAGKNDPVRIDMPKGSYVPTFSHQTVKETATDPVEEAGIQDNWPCVLILKICLFLSIGRDD